MFIFDLLMLAACGALACHMLLERVRLKRFVAGLDIRGSDAIEVAKQVAGHLTQSIKQGDDPPFLHSLLSTLGASPGAVIRFGGCCSGISRLCILALRELGISAWQVGVYAQTGEARHCLLQADTERGPIILDPTYGLYYVGEGGEPISLEALRSGAAVRFRPLPGCRATSYPPFPYYDFDYTSTKTANWTKSWLRRVFYSVGRSLGAQLDVVRIPWLLEWPQVLVMAPLACAYAVVRALGMFAL